MFCGAHPTALPCTLHSHDLITLSSCLHGVGGVMIIWAPRGTSELLFLSLMKMMFGRRQTAGEVKHAGGLFWLVHVEERL